MTSIFKKGAEGRDLKALTADARRVVETSYGGAIVETRTLKDTRRRLVEAIHNGRPVSKEDGPLVHMIVEAVLCDNSIKSRCKKSGETDDYSLPDKIGSSGSDIKLAVLTAVISSFKGGSLSQENPISARPG